MNITAIIVAALVVGCVGIILGFFLGISGEKFKVEVDPREEAVLGVLPGNNCGGCGYAGCSGLAAAIAKGEAPVGQCPVGGDPVAAKVAEIMGVEAGAGVKKVAFVKCAGTCEKANVDYDYSGVQDCVAMSFVPNGGPKSCNYAAFSLLHGCTVNNLGLILKFYTNCPQQIMTTIDYSHCIIVYPRGFCYRTFSCYSRIYCCLCGICCC